MTPTEEIFALYPRKIGKRTALLKIEQALRRVRQEARHLADMSDEQIVQIMKNTVILFASSPAGKKGQYTPHPATWFNQSRYLDSIEEWFNADETKHDTLARRNSEALATVFGKLPDAHQSPFFEGTDSRGRRSLENLSLPLFLEGD